MQAARRRSAAGSSPARRRTTSSLGQSATAGTGRHPASHASRSSRNAWPTCSADPVRPVAGVEISAGLGYAAGRFSVETRVRELLAHRGAQSMRTSGGRPSRTLRRCRVLERHYVARFAAELHARQLHTLAGRRVRKHRATVRHCPSLCGTRCLCVGKEEVKQTLWLRPTTGESVAHAPRPRLPWWPQCSRTALERAR